MCISNPRSHTALVSNVGSKGGNYSRKSREYQWSSTSSLTRRRSALDTPKVLNPCEPCSTVIPVAVLQGFLVESKEVLSDWECRMIHLFKPAPLESLRQAADNPRETRAQYLLFGLEYPQCATALRVHRLLLAHLSPLAMVKILLSLDNSSRVLRSLSDRTDLNAVPRLVGVE